MLQQGIRAMRCVISLILLIGVLSCSDTNQSLPGSVGAFDTGADITIDAATMTSQWPLATPSELGLSAEPLLNLHNDVLQGRYGWIDSLLIIRDGRIAFEQYYEHDYRAIYGEEARTPGPLVVNSPGGPYNYFNAFWHPYFKDTQLHSMQSVTKSIVSAAIGIAISRGDFPDLDTPVLSFFDVDKTANVDEKKQTMTLRHLLTMSEGLRWNENVPYIDPTNTFTVMARSLDWVQFTLDQPMAAAPGTRFNYNSGASLILGQIFLQSTGIDIEAYTAQHLFRPLGITDYEWKRTPFGLADTQEGLFLSTTDLAKIAYLYLQKGRWNHKTVIPESWINDSLRVSFELQDDLRTGYGFTWWSQWYQYQDKRYIAYLGKGFGGQRPIILPDFDMVIVVTGWNILPDKPFLHAEEAIERVVSSVIE